jgi:hypothetical protein
MGSENDLEVETLSNSTTYPDTLSATSLEAALVVERWAKAVAALEAVATNTSVDRLGS